MELNKKIFLLGIVTLPFFYWPFSVIPYEVPKVWLTLVWIVSLAIVTALSHKRSKSVHWSPLVFVLFFYFFLAVISSIQGSDIAKSFVGNPFRVDGLMTLSALIALALLSKDLVAQKLSNKLSSGLTFTHLALCIWAIANFLLLHRSLIGAPMWGGAVGISFGQPNFLAGYLLVTVPFVWHYFQIHHSKINFVFYMLLCCAAIATTYSWGAGLGVLLFMFFVATQKLNTSFVTYWIAATLFLILLFFTLSYLQDRQFSLPEGRSRIYASLLLSVVERPKLGWGIANVDHAFTAATQTNGYQHDVYLDKAHSELLEILVTTGVIGFITFLLLLIGVIYQLGYKKKQLSVWDKTILMVLLLYLFHSQTNVISISEQILFWIVVGIAL